MPRGMIAITLDLEPLVVHLKLKNSNRTRCSRTTHSLLGNRIIYSRTRGRPVTCLLCLGIAGAAWP